MPSGNNYLLISVPVDTSVDSDNRGYKEAVDDCRQEVLLALRQKLTVAQALSEVDEIQVGTMDQLVLAADELGKMEMMLESSVSRIIQESIDVFVRTFQWNLMKYRSDRPLKEIIEGFAMEANQIDTLLKSKMSSYNQVKGSVNLMERKATGNLLVRNLGEVVKKEDFVLNSEFMETVLVLVPKAMKEAFLATYEKLCDLVVPRSAKSLAEDADYSLFAVVVFSKIVEEFKRAAKEQKYQIREWKYDEEAIEKERKDQKAAIASSKEQWANLLRLLKTNFSESFSAMIHVKCLRAYVESVLRYGLPPTFAFLALKTKSRNEKKIRENVQLALSLMEERGIVTRLDYENFKKKKAPVEDIEGNLIKREQVSEPAAVTDEELAAAGLSSHYYPYVHLAIQFSIQ